MLWNAKKGYSTIYYIVILSLSLIYKAIVSEYFSTVIKEEL